MPGTSKEGWMKIIHIRSVVFFIFMATSFSLSAFPIRLLDDLASVVYEQYYKTRIDKTNLSASQDQFSSLYLFSGIPLPDVAHRPLYFGVEGDFLSRDGLILDGQNIIPSPLFRAGIFFGSRCFTVGKNEFFLYFVTGISGNSKDLPRDAVYFQPIVEWHYKISPELTVGFGMQFQYNYGRWTSLMGLPFNPLPTLSWQATPSTIFRINWDNITLSHGFTSMLTGLLEAKYAFHFMKLENRLSYEYENIWIGGGIDLRIYRDIHLRLQIKKDISTEERIYLGEKEVGNYWRNPGYGFKITLVYMN